jgi:anti-sigma B factor antagonist
MSEPEQSYVNLSATPTVVTARIGGPTLGDREGDVVGPTVVARITENGKSTKAVVLDFSDVDFISSAGLGACVIIRNASKSVGAKTVLYGLSPRLLEGFRLTKLDKIFDIAGDEKKLEKLTR